MAGCSLGNHYTILQVFWTKSPKQYITKAMPKIIFEFEGNHQEVALLAEEVSKKQIEELVSETWGLKNNEFTLTYLDMDGDEITAEVEEDFEVAKMTMLDSNDKLDFKLRLVQEAQPKFLPSNAKQAELDLDEAVMEWQMAEKLIADEEQKRRQEEERLAIQCEQREAELAQRQAEMKQAAENEAKRVQAMRKTEQQQKMVQQEKARLKEEARRRAQQQQKKEAEMSQLLALKEEQQKAKAQEEKKIKEMEAADKKAAEKKAAEEKAAEKKAAQKKAAEEKAAAQKKAAEKKLADKKAEGEAKAKKKAEELQKKKATLQANKKAEEQKPETTKIEQIQDKLKDLEQEKSGNKAQKTDKKSKPESAEKKQKPVAKSPFKEQKSIADDLALKQLIRQEVLAMLPEIRERLSKQENSQIFDIKCRQCAEGLKLPCYYDPAGETYLCRGCEARDQGTTPLIKIRDQSLLRDSVIAGLITFKKEEVKQPENTQAYLVDLRTLSQAQVKLMYQEKIQQLRQKVQAEKKKQAQAATAVAAKQKPKKQEAKKEEAKKEDVTVEIPMESEFKAEAKKE